MLGPLMIDIEGTELSASDRELLTHPSIGGVILFARNYANPDQARALCDAIHALRNPALLIAVDQEGGRVQRFRDGFVELPPLASLGELYDQEPARALREAADHAWLMASELRAVGVDFSFSPVLDLRNGASAVIGDRALHGDARIVARLAHVYVATLNACGMAAVGKHFPGHGGVDADSHLVLPVDERDFDDLDRSDLLPFRLLVEAGIHGLMMAHVLYPRIDAVAAGYSQRWIEDILRREMRYEGVVFSDDLSMAGAALSVSHAERAQRALAAGCDVLLVCNQRSAVVEIVDALGSNPYPTTQARLMRMHARGRALDFADLKQTERWRNISRQFDEKNRFPELSLGDDNLLG